MSYQAQAKLIAILELIVCACGLVGLAASAIVFVSRKDELAKDEAKLEKFPNLREFIESSPSEQAMTFLIPGLLLTGELILAGMLYVGASEKHSGLLKAWTTMSMIMAGVGLVFAGFGIVAADEKIGPIAVTVFGYTLTGYSLWVGYALSKEGSGSS